MSTNVELIQRATSITRTASENGATIRLLGGVAVAILCSDIYSRYPVLERTPHDIDFMGYAKQSHKITRAMKGIEIAGDQRFNALYGNMRLKFLDNAVGETPMVIDVFLDKFKQSHEIPMKGRLEKMETTITPTDLLMTKLQIWEINQKDIQDIVSLLAADGKFSGSDARIDEKRIADLTSDDWGLWKTSMNNIAKVHQFIESLDPGNGLDSEVLPKLERINRTLSDSKKSIRWKMRSVVGEKVPWYETPEEV